MLWGSAPRARVGVSSSDRWYTVGQQKEPSVRRSAGTRRVKRLARRFHEVRPRGRRRDQEIQGRMPAPTGTACRGIVRHRGRGRDPWRAWAASWRQGQPLQGKVQRVLDLVPVHGKRILAARAHDEGVALSPAVSHHLQHRCDARRRLDDKQGHRWRHHDQAVHEVAAFHTGYDPGASACGDDLVELGGGRIDNLKPPLDRQPLGNFPFVDEDPLRASPAAQQKDAGVSLRLRPQQSTWRAGRRHGPAGPCCAPSCGR